MSPQLPVPQLRGRTHQPTATISAAGTTGKQLRPQDEETGGRWQLWLTFQCYLPCHPLRQRRVPQLPDESRLRPATEEAIVVTSSAAQSRYPASCG
jgi:hypothetical protein